MIFEMAAVIGYRDVAALEMTMPPRVSTRLVSTVTAAGLAAALMVGSATAQTPPWVRAYVGEIKLVHSSYKCPFGMIPADGRLVKKADYPKLFERYGYKYTHNSKEIGSDSFRVPMVRIVSWADSNFDDAAAVPVPACLATLRSVDPPETLIGQIRLLPDDGESFEGQCPSEQLIVADGRELAVYNHQALFLLLGQGNRYGGNLYRFNVPRVRIPSWFGNDPELDTVGPVKSCVSNEGFFPGREEDPNTPDETHYVGEVILMGTDYCPWGTVPADGRLLSISKDNLTVFATLGTRYGGDGKANFRIPKIILYSWYEYVPVPKHTIQACVVLEGIFPAVP